MRRAASILAVLVCLVLGCYSEGPVFPSLPAIRSSASPTLAVVTPSPSGEQSASPGPPLVAPVAAPGELLYYCGSVPFPVRALVGLGADELADHPAAEALRRSMGTIVETIGAPVHGWHYVGQSLDVVEFAQWSPDGERGSAVYVVLQRQGGAFVLKNWGGCFPLRLAAPPGKLALEWFTPEPPEPTASVINVDLVAAVCAGGPDLELIEPPIVQPAAESVSVAMIARYVEGRTGCEKTGCGDVFPTTVEVTLPEAIGSRRLLDLSVFPARDAGIDPFNRGCGG